MYDKTYYDGYGYNYYTGNYGYYAYSRPPRKDSGPYWHMSMFFTVLAIFLAVISAFVTLYYLCDTGKISCGKRKKDECDEHLNQSLTKSKIIN